jgi:hypothetical protein
MPLARSKSFTGHSPHQVKPASNFEPNRGSGRLGMNSILLADVMVSTTFIVFAYIAIAAAALVIFV